MAKLLFSLRGVPDEEAAEVRQILSDNALEFYETPAGKWGISAPALWLKTDEDYDKARQLFDDYQQRRFQEQREKYIQLKTEGRQRTFADVIKEDPLRFIVYLLLIGIILYFSIHPFLSL